MILTSLVRILIVIKNFGSRVRQTHTVYIGERGGILTPAGLNLKCGLSILTPLIYGRILASRLVKGLSYCNDRDYIGLQDKERKRDYPRASHETSLSGLYFVRFRVTRVDNLSSSTLIAIRYYAFADEVFALSSFSEVADAIGYLKRGILGFDSNPAERAVPLFIERDVIESVLVTKFIGHFCIGRVEGVETSWLVKSSASRGCKLR